MTAPDSVCGVEVHRGTDWDFSHGPCGNKAKGQLADGSPACGVHLRVEADALARRQVRSDFDARKAAVTAALGIEVWGYEITSPLAVTVKLADLERLAARVESPGTPS